MRTLHHSTPPEEELVAKPVRYRHVQTRSITEGRWLVWLDEMALPWHYEPEPVTLHGRPRWPDLWLPTLGGGLWAEIKPAGTPPDEALSLALAEQTGSGLLWVAGTPWPGDYAVTWFHAADREPIPNLRWALGRRDKRELWLCDPGAVLSVRLSPAMTGPMTWEEARGMEFPLFDCHALREAYRVASTWRFEEAP